MDINTLPLAWFCPECCRHPADNPPTAESVIDNENAAMESTNAMTQPVAVADFVDAAPRTPTKPSRPALKMHNRERSMRLHASPSAKPSSSIPSTFRLVTVPKGVNPGEEFRVIISPDTSEGNAHKDDVVIGVICPRGAHGGDSIVVLEPGNIHPLISPVEIVKINRRLFARDNGRGGIDGGLPTPGHEDCTTEEGSSSLLDMIDSAVTDAFWEVLWPFLRSQGWSCNRQLHFDFGAVKFSPPTPLMGASRAAAAATTTTRPAKDSIRYYHSLRGIRTCISGDIKYAQALDSFDAAIVRRKKAVMARYHQMRQQQLQQSPRAPDEWKCMRNRKYIRLGKEFQVTQPLPRAGTNIPGEGARCM